MTRPSHRIHLNTQTGPIFGEEYKLSTFSLYTFPESPVTSLLPQAQIFSSVTLQFSPVVNFLPEYVSDKNVELAILVPNARV